MRSEPPGRLSRRYRARHEVTRRTVERHGRTCTAIDALTAAKAAEGGGQRQLAAIPRMARGHPENGGAAWSDLHRHRCTDGPRYRSRQLRTSRRRCHRAALPPVGRKGHGPQAPVAGGAAGLSGRARCGALPASDRGSRTGCVAGHRPRGRHLAGPPFAVAAPDGGVAAGSGDGVRGSGNGAGRPGPTRVRDPAAAVPCASGRSAAGLPGPRGGWVPGGVGAATPDGSGRGHAGPAAVAPRPAPRAWPQATGRRGGRPPSVPAVAACPAPPRGAPHCPRPSTGAGRALPGPRDGKW